MIADLIRTTLNTATAACELPDVESTLEHPVDVTHGDYASNVALILAKHVGQNSREVAARIVAAAELPEEIDHLSVAGPGFINVHLARTFFRDAVRDVLSEGERWGANTSEEGKKVLVEHTQPNPFKPFHIGHLMSNSLGESVSRLYDFAGAEVTRLNYQGDVGLHVGKALWGLRTLGGDPSNIDDLAAAYVHGNTAYEEDEELKREIVAFNKMVYAHAKEIEEAYKTGRAVSLAHFEELYKLLGSSFDHYFFESEAVAPGRVMVKEGLAEGVFAESDGAVVFKGEEYSLHTRVFLTREGLPTYEAKELGLAQLKAERYAFDLSITTTAVEQQEYFKVVYTALGMLRPELVGKLLHVPHGMMVLTTGKMSSRKGNVVTGESLLADMMVRAREKVDERDFSDEEKGVIAEAVAVAAVKYSILKQKAGKNITFDPEAALSFDGDSGPYLQYAHTRAVSVLQKGAQEGVVPATVLAPAEPCTVERLVYRFPEVVERAQREFEPHHITTYLVDLAASWNQYYAAEKILDGSPTAPYKLAVAQAVAQTLRNGLWVLGIQAPERM